jgi:hypothetical protein
LPWREDCWSKLNEVHSRQMLQQKLFESWIYVIVDKIKTAHNEINAQL